MVTGNGSLTPICSLSNIKPFLITKLDCTRYLKPNAFSSVILYSVRQWRRFCLTLMTQTEKPIWKALTICQCVLSVTIRQLHCWVNGGPRGMKKTHHCITLYCNYIFWIYYGAAQYTMYECNRKKDQSTFNEGKVHAI